MSLKDTIRNLTPTFILKLNRKRKKSVRNSQLSRQNSEGKSITEQELISQLQNIGIVKGDSVLVHSALSRIGYLKDGPKTLIDALLSVVGVDGNILMPTSPNNVYQLNYIQNTPFFDVENTPSKTGAITEYFRKLPNSIRSLHPTEPVSVVGPLASYYTDEHFNQLTPYNSKSPFYKLSQKKGKILYIGVTLSMAGTSLHTLEDAIKEFKYPVYYPQIFTFKIIDKDKVEHTVKTKVHNPEWSKKRKCDDLIPMFESKNALKKVKIGEAKTLLVDADKFLQVMLDEYNQNGITMYTPNGN